MIWLVGTKGLLGSEVRTLLEGRGLRHVATGSETDIRDEDVVLSFARAHRPTWIVNCAAYTAVDRAESEEPRAYEVNALGPKNLAQAASEVGARLVHVSTDYVFDGDREGPYPEDAPVHPLGAYGRTKAAGDAFVREACPHHVIVRTAWLHGPHGPSFVSTMLRLLAERAEISVVDDQRGTPTYAVDLAEALLAFVAANSTASGTYHYANSGECTRHAFATEIQAQALAGGLLTRRIPIRPISTAAYPTPARRPANSSLATGKIRAALRIEIPSWQDGLRRHLVRRLAARERPVEGGSSAAST